VTHSISLIGGGSTTVGFLLEILALIKSGQISPKEASELVINIHEESSILGAGAPYDLTKTGFQLISNIRNISGTLPQNGADFLQWLEVNKEFVGQVFDKIFEQRLAARIAKEPDKEKQFRQSYEVIIGSFKEKYLNLGDSAKTYHPRILYGIYRVALFEQIVEDLRQKGVVINQHGKSKIVNFNENSKGKFELVSSGPQTTESDFVLFAGGMVEKAPGIIHENFLPSQWPEENLIAQLEKALKKAEESGRHKIEIAILGSSLTAIDAVRTILFDKIFQKDLRPADIEIKISLLSRDGRLPKVRAAYAPFDYKNDGKTFPAISILEEVQELHKTSGQVHLWQILKMCAEKMAVFYRHFGQEEKAQKAQGFASFIADKENNYAAILEKFSQLEGSQGFSQLELELKNAISGDVEGLLGYQVAYGLIGPARPEILALLNADDKKIYQEFFATLHNFNDSPMPIPVAEDLLKLHKQGMVDIVKLGRADTPLEIEKYDLFVRADGYVKTLDQSPAPLHQQIAKYADHAKVFAPYQPGIGVNAAQEFGKDAADKIMSMITGRKIEKTSAPEIKTDRVPRQVVAHLETMQLLSSSKTRDATLA